MAPSPKLYCVVCYDIVDDKVRKKISDVLEDFGGRRVQYSVFECEMTPSQFEKLYRKLHRLRQDSDSVRYYFLCRRCLERAKADEDVELRQRWPEEVVKVI